MKMTFFANGLFGKHAGGDDVSSYKPVPFYISSDNKGFFLETKSYTKFDFTQDNRIIIKIADSYASGRLLVGDSPKVIVREYTRLCGRMDGLPEWALEGIILGIQGGEEAVQDIVKNTIDAGVPLAAVW